MRVLLVNKFHYEKGGAETAYFETARELIENGHDIAFFSMKHPKNKPSRWEKYFIEEIDYNNEKSILSKIKYALKFIYNTEAKNKFEKLVENFKPDIVHFHNIYHQITPSVLGTLKKRNIPSVMTLHDYKLICSNYKLYNKNKICEKCKGGKHYNCFLNKCIKDSWSKSLLGAIEAYFHKVFKSYSGINLFISPSNFLKNKFTEFGFEDDIKILPNPISKSFLSNEKTSPGKYILYFGRISEEKGVIDLVKAYSEMDTSLGLKIIGDGPSKEQLKTLVEKNRLKAKVEFIPHSDKKSLKKEILNSAFVVMPSLWYENMPYAALEVLLLQKILLCVKLGGFEEIVIDRKTGYFFKVGDIKSLKENLHFLIYNLEKCDKIVKQNLKNDKNLTIISNNYHNYLINLYKGCL